LQSKSDPVPKQTEHTSKIVAKLGMRTPGQETSFPETPQNKLPAARFKVLPELHLIAFPVEFED
jgi:hypothetical protein